MLRQNIDSLTGKERTANKKHDYITKGNIIQPLAFTGYFNYVIYNSECLKEGNMSINEICTEANIEGLSLKALGINETAFSYEQVCKIVDYLRINRITILGGDVYLVDGNNLKITYDSWYIKKEEKMDFEKSYKKALDYMEIFEKKEEDYVYSIVIHE